MILNVLSLAVIYNEGKEFLCSIAFWCIFLCICNAITITRSNVFLRLISLSYFSNVTNPLIKPFQGCEAMKDNRQSRYIKAI